MGQLDEYIVGVDGPWDELAAGHLYRRAGFGSTPGERSAAVGNGDQESFRAAVDWVVDFAAEDPALDISAGIVEPTFGDPIPDLPDEAIPGDEVSQILAEIKSPATLQQLQGWWLYRMRHTSQPLQEQLALFLHDHLVSEYDKVFNLVPAAVNLGNDGSLPLLQACTQGTLAPDLTRAARVTTMLAQSQNDLYRRTGMNSYRELLIAATRDPFMLIYLDNIVNQKGAAQENYAREMMELFSMGVGNYSEQDVREIAKCLTGETLQHWVHGLSDSCAHNFSTAYGFVPDFHENGSKFVFGTTVPEDMTGQETVAVVDLIMNKVSVNPNAAQFSTGYTTLPATAVYTAWKLLTWFVHHNVNLTPQPDAAVLELADYLRGTDHSDYPSRRYPFDLKAALRKIFLSRYFYEEVHRLQMHKTPVDFVVSALRGLGVDDLYTLNDGPTRYLGLMGMRLFNPPSVAGWNHGHAWTSSGNVILRFFYALHLAYDVVNEEEEYGQLVMDNYLAANGGPVSDENDDEGLVDALDARLLHGTMTYEEHQLLVSAASEIKALVPNPAFARQIYYSKFQAMVFLIMTMPKFQLK